MQHTILLLAAALSYATSVPAAEPVAADKRLRLVTAPTEQLGTERDDQILALIRQPDGGIVLGGYEGGVLGAEDGWPVGDAVGFVERRRANGERLWRHDFDTAGSDVVDALSMTTDGSIVVAGRTTDAFPGQTQHGQVDAFVATLAADGTRQSLVQAGDERPQHPVAVAVTASGDVVLAGYDDIYVETNFVIDWHNGFLARFARGKDGSLALRWWLRSPIPANDFIQGVAAAGGRSDDVFVAMQVAASAAAGGGVFVRRVDRSGRVVWSHLVSAASLDTVAALALGGTGTLYVAGSTVTALGAPSLGHSDGFVMALDAQLGQRRWIQRMQAPDPTWISGLDIDRDGNVHIVGSAFLAEDVEAARARNYAVGQAWSAEGEALARWQTQVSTEPQWSDTLRVAAGRSVHDLVVAGAVDGSYAEQPYLGGQDRILFSPVR